MTHSKLHIKLRKIDKMAHLAFLNALRLHEDAVNLYRQKRLPSALFLSAISMEELGKYFILEDLVFHSRVEGRYDHEWENELLFSTYSHTTKQSIFHSHIFHEPFGKSVFKALSSTRFEKIKQNALYVGLPRRGSKVQIKAPISSPFQTNKRTVRELITTVNTFLLLLAAGVYNEYYSLDILEVEEEMTLELIKKLRKL